MRYRLLRLLLVLSLLTLTACPPHPKSAQIECPRRVAGAESKEDIMTKILEQTTVGGVTLQMLDNEDGTYQMVDPNAHHRATDRYETAQYDYRKAIEAREGHGPTPAGYYLAGLVLALLLVACGGRNTCGLPMGAAASSSGDVVAPSGGGTGGAGVTWIAASGAGVGAGLGSGEQLLTEADGCTEAPPPANGIVECQAQLPGPPLTSPLLSRCTPGSHAAPRARS